MFSSYFMKGAVVVVIVW